MPEGPAFLMMRCCDGTSFKKASPYRVRDELFSKLNEPVLEAKAVNSGALLVKTAATSQTERLLETTVFLGKEVEVEIPSRLNTAAGTIYAPELLNEPLEIIVQESQGQGVSKISRFPSRNGRPNALLKIHFWGTEVPSHFIAGYARFPVRPWVDKPKLCQKCLKYGHLRDQCKARKGRCCNCSEEHVGDCVGPSKCASCGGPHVVGSEVCSAWKRAVEEAQEKAPKLRSYDQWPSLPPVATRKSYADMAKSSPPKLSSRRARVTPSPSARSVVPPISSAPASGSGPGVGPPLHSQPLSGGDQSPGIAPVTNLPYGSADPNMSAAGPSTSPPYVRPSSSQKSDSDVETDRTVIASHSPDVDPNTSAAHASTSAARPSVSLSCDSESDTDRSLSPPRTRRSTLRKRNQTSITPLRRCFIEEKQEHSK